MRNILFVLSILVLSAGAAHAQEQLGAVSTASADHAQVAPELQLGAVGTAGWFDVADVNNNHMDLGFGGTLRAGVKFPVAGLQAPTVAPVIAINGDLLRVGNSGSRFTVWDVGPVVGLRFGSEDFSGIVGGLVGVAGTNRDELKLGWTYGPLVGVAVGPAFLEARYQVHHLEVKAVDQTLLLRQFLLAVGFHY
jgi:hypothetical protein